MSESLGTQFPIEQARVRDLLKEYHRIGPAGAFGAAMLEQTLKRADTAALGGDLVEMIQAFKEMQGCE